MPKTDHRALPEIDILKAKDRITVAPTEGTQAYLDHSMEFRNLVQSAIDAGLFDSILPADSTLTANGISITTIPSGNTYDLSIQQGGVDAGSWDAENEVWVIPECPDTTISLPQAPSTTNQDAGETLVFTVKDEAGVDFANSMVSVSVVAQAYAILLSNNIITLNKDDVGVPFSRRLPVDFDLQDPDNNEVAATLFSQSGAAFTFELAWVNVLIRSTETLIYNENFINGQSVQFDVEDSAGTPIAATMVDVQIRVSDGSLTIGGVTFPAPKAGEAVVLGAVDSNDDPITVVNDGGVLKVPALPCAPSSPNVGWNIKTFTDTQTALDAGTDGVDYYTLSENNFFGNTLRLTGKTGGGYDGTDFVDVNGNTTTKALAYPDDLVLIHDIRGRYDATNKKVLCIDVTLQSSDTYNNHLAAAASYSTGGIGAGRWFIPTIAWWYMLARQTGSSQYAFNHEPFTNEFNINSFVFCTEQAGLTGDHLVYRPRYNTTGQNDSGDTDPCVYFCWFDLETD